MTFRRGEIHSLELALATDSTDTGRTGLLSELTTFPNYGRCATIRVAWRRSGTARAEFPPNKLTQPRIPGNDLRRPSSEKSNG
jgi:hypothetical protein